MEPGVLLRISFHSAKWLLHKTPLWSGMLSVCVAAALTLPGVLPAYVLRPTLCTQGCSLSVHFFYPVSLVYFLQCSQKELCLLACSLSVHFLHSPLPALLSAYALRRTLCDWAFSLSVQISCTSLCKLYFLPVFFEVTGSFCKAALVFLPSACHLASLF